MFWRACLSTRYGRGRRGYFTLWQSLWIFSSYQRGILGSRWLVLSSWRQDCNLSIMPIALRRLFHSERMHRMSLIHPSYDLVCPHRRRLHRRMPAILLALKGEFIAWIISLSTHHMEQELVIALIFTPIWWTNPYRWDIAYLVQDGTDALLAPFISAVYSSLLPKHTKTWVGRTFRI